MARSRKSSPKMTYEKRFNRKTISFASTSGDISHSTSASASSTDVTKLSLHSSSISSINCSGEKDLSNKNVSKNSGKSELTDFSHDSEKFQSTRIKENAGEFCSNAVQSNSAFGEICSPFDSSVWSVRPSDVFKTLDNKKSLNKSRSCNKSRRKTLTLGDKRENLDDFTPIATFDSVELPPTQPSGPLKDVIAFVEVYSGAENRTRYIANEIRNLGATVSQRFTNKVTHVIFREGLQSTIEKARARNIPCVSALWIDSCSKRNEKVPEDEFRICDVSESGVPIIVGRLRKPKSMQPERFDPDVVLSDERVKRRVKRAEAYRLMKEIKNFNVDSCATASDDKSFDKLSNPVLVEDTPMSKDLLRRTENVDRSSNAPGWRAFTETFTPDSLRMQMSQLQRKIAGLLGSPCSSADSSFEEDSLAENVKKRLFGPGGLLHGTPPPAFLDKQRASRVFVPCSIERSTPRKEIFKGGKIDDSPVLTRRRFIIRDSIDNSDGAVSDRIDDVEKIIPETNTVELMPPPPHSDEENETNCAKTQKHRNGEIFGQPVASQEHSYVYKSITHGPSAIPREDFSLPTGDTTAVRSSPSSSADSSHVSVGPIVVIRRKSTDGKLLSTVVNTSAEKLHDVLAKDTIHPSVVVRRRILEDENDSFSDSNVKKVKENSAMVVKSRVSVADKFNPTDERSASIAAGRSSNLNKSNQNENTSAKTNVDSVQKVIDDVCRQVFSTNSHPTNKSASASNVCERKKHLFNADDQVFRLWSESATISLSHEPTSIIEKISTNTFNKDDIGDVFEPKDVTKKKNEKTKRLRSSLFFVKTSSALANELQFGRPSPEEFRSKNGADATSKKIANDRRKTIAASSNNVKNSPKIVKKSNNSRSNINRPSLVLTSVVGSDRDVVHAAVKKLGKFSIDARVGDNTTHVVCGDVRRTLTVLYGIVRGCYILSLEWVFRSIEHGKWLKHDDFLIKQFRMSKIVRKKSKCTLLSEFGQIYVSPECKPPMKDIKSLIKLCGGNLSTNSKRSKICIGKMKNQENVDSAVVAEIWLLDSITKQKLLPFDTYYL